MQKKKAARLAGFVGALCASGALVGVAVSGTGAYFSDSAPGTINASTGHIKLSTSSTTLNFSDLLPGDYQTKTINYTAQPKGGTEDVWLVLPNYGQSGDAFASHPEAGATPLGRYGHFEVSSSGGAHFTSYNLSLDPNLGSANQDSCYIDSNGWGGSAAPASSASDPIPYCAPAKAILLQSNMHSGNTGQVNLTFGYTPLLQNGPSNVYEDNSVTPLEHFEIVATQHNVRPDDPNNP